MTDCAGFLQWALPHRDLHWPGFRRVHRQVCKRVKRRMHELGLSSFAAYRARLEADPTEWRTFDQCCHVTISRFFRDRAVFDALRQCILPAIAARAERQQREARVWSAGCASGEEPYTVKIIWDLETTHQHPGVPLAVIATDVDDTMLARARRGCFPATSLRELPPHLLERAFDRTGTSYCLKSRHREGIEFISQDLRSEVPFASFDLVLCRNVAFTYFALSLQERVLAHMIGRLLPNGYLAIGTHERLPADGSALVPLAGAPHIFKKPAAA